jgi:hypothetical protein
MLDGDTPTRSSRTLKVGSRCWLPVEVAKRNNCLSSGDRTSPSTCCGFIPACCSSSGGTAEVLETGCRECGSTKGDASLGDEGEGRALEEGAGLGILEAAI